MAAHHFVAHIAEGTAADHYSEPAVDHVADHNFERTAGHIVVGIVGHIAGGYQLVVGSSTLDVVGLAGQGGCSSGSFHGRGT